jgi:NaMN:DMB phosphoribosyltransferase
LKSIATIGQNIAAEDAVVVFGEQIPAGTTLATGCQAVSHARNAWRVTFLTSASHSWLM